MLQLGAKQSSITKTLLEDGIFENQDTKTFSCMYVLVNAKHLLMWNSFGRWARRNFVQLFGYHNQI